MIQPEYKDIFSLSNLFIALRKALRGKRHRKSVQKFLSNCRSEMRKLRDELKNESWVPGKYETFLIHEPKEREISAAPFRDRVVHHAIINICEPIFEKYQIYHSYACRKGKGQQAAVFQAQKNQRRYNYFLKMDIRKYFASINHTTLEALLAHSFYNSQIRTLFSKIIRINSTNFGLPIGNLTSQHFANFYLSKLDHYLIDYIGVEGYIRYMDDFIVWGSSKRELKELRDSVSEYLEKELSLSLKKEIERLAPTTFGLPFLGFRIVRNSIRMSKTSIARFNRKIKWYHKRVLLGEIDEIKAMKGTNSIYAFISQSSPKKFQRDFARKYFS